MKQRETGTGPRRMWREVGAGSANRRGQCSLGKEATVNGACRILKRPSRHRTSRRLTLTFPFCQDACHGASHPTGAPHHAPDRVEGPVAPPLERGPAGCSPDQRRTMEGMLCDSQGCRTRTPSCPGMESQPPWVAQPWNPAAMGGSEHMERSQDPTPAPPNHTPGWAPCRPPASTNLPAP